MKKIFVVAFLCVVSNNLTAQISADPATGYVGIGTTNSQGPLTVKGGSHWGQIKILPYVDGAETGLTFSAHTLETDYTSMWFTGVGGWGLGESYTIGSSIAGWASMTFLTNGNVGVGTDNPVSMFQVDDGATKMSIGDASGPTLNWGTSYLGFNASRSGTNWLTNGDGYNNGGGVIYSSIFGDLYFAPVPDSGGGNQTISDQNMTNNIALHIDRYGKTYAKQVIVQAIVYPDYVFESVYKLPPLSQIKAFIDQNHHLPEMPTAKEVEANGLDLGKTNELLTRKVEELTLYLIEEEKEIQELKKKVEQLSRLKSKIK